jgi:cell division protein FtsL
MAMVMLVASLPLGMVWKQYAYVNLSRGLQTAERDRGRLQNEVLLLETEVRGLMRTSRLETLARDRFGLIDPGPPILVQPEGAVLAGAGGSDGTMDTLKAASWRERAGWRTNGF